MIEDKRKEVIYGPAIVAVANGMRAFDAPARYPMLLSKSPARPGYTPTLSEAITFSGYSSFIVMIEHILGMLILLPLMLFVRGPKHILQQLKSFELREWLSLLMI